MKKSVLTTLALSAVLAAFAAEPVKVGFSPVPNPTGDTENPFPLYIGYGQELWGDYNNDGKLDRFIIGGQGDGEDGKHFYLYRNEGSFFSKVETSVTPLGAATAVLLDYDNDGYLDILITGKDPDNASHNELWRNTGEEGGYTFEKDETFTDFGICDHEYQSRCNYMIAADFDNDGWIDMFATGHVDGDWYAKLYRNDNGYFEELEHPVNDNMGRRSLAQIVKGSIQAADFNNDGYVDLVLSGEDAADGYKTKTTVYFNNGDGTFREITDNSVFAGQNRGTTFAADINDDGYMDIIEMGDNSEVGRDIGDGRKRIAHIYINNKNETFAAAIIAEDSGLLEMRAMPSTGDVNNDGYVDILVTGGWEDDFTHLFYNSGNNTFTDEFLPRETNGRDGVASLVDFDGDGALDISLEGWCDDWHNVLLINDWAEGLPFPQAPAAPTNFNVTQNGEDVVLTWNKSTDDTTPSDAIRYNIYIQAKEADTDGYKYTYTYAPADIKTGFLKHTGKPHLISGTTITMKGFDKNDFNFGVQAIDNGWLASAFVTYTGGTDGIGSTESDKIIVRTVNGKISLDNAEFCTYSIYGVNGQLIAQQISGNESVAVVNGTYIVKITKGSEVITRKAVVF